MLADKLEFSVNGRKPDSRSGRYFPDRDGQNDLPLANSGTSRLNI
jgi:hypothetical protein